MEKIGVSLEDQVSGLKEDIRQIDSLLGDGMLIKLGTEKHREVKKQRDMLQQQIEQLQQAAGIRDSQ